MFSLIKILIWAKRFLNKENAKMIKVVKKILEKINLIGIAMMLTAQAAFAAAPAPPADLRKYSKKSYPHVKSAANEYSPPHAESQTPPS